MMVQTRRGRARKSVEELKLAGQYRADRHADTSPLPKGKPIKPAYLTGEASALWDFITPRLEELEIATDLDSQTLASMCEWWAEFRDASRGRAEYEEGLKLLAREINRLSTHAFAHGVTSDLLDRLGCTIGDMVEQRSKQDVRRVNRMKSAYAEFSRIAARFGMTPVDRRAMRDVTTETRDDPFSAFLKERQQPA